MSLHQVSLLMVLLLTLSWLVTIVPFKVFFFWLKEYSSILNCRPAKKEKLPYDLLPLKSDCFGTLKERKKEKDLMDLLWVLSMIFHLLQKH
ncbi:unnamed protein product [Camellia sinensis]